MEIYWSHRWPRLSWQICANFRSTDTQLCGPIENDGPSKANKKHWLGISLLPLRRSFDVFGTETNHAIFAIVACACRIKRKSNIIKMPSEWPTVFPSVFLSRYIVFINISLSLFSALFGHCIADRRIVCAAACFAGDGNGNKIIICLFLPNMKLITWLFEFYRGKSSV